MPKQPRPPSSLNRPDTHPESDAEAKGAPSSSRVRGPKEPPTAYSLFVKDTAAAQSIPIYEASKLWKEASDTDRTKYNNQAAYFKAEFEAALANPKKRLARGTLPPKKPLTACNLFTAERRAQLQSQGVNMSYNQVCALWSGLSDAEKQVYAAKAVPLREQYDKNFAAFIAAGGIPVQRRKRDATLPKLPIRPFQLFTQDQKGKGLRLPAVSAIWKSLSAETKKVYFAKAAADYDIYKRQMKALGHEVQPYRGGYDEHDVHGPKNGVYILPSFSQSIEMFIVELEVASGLTYVSGREEKDAKNEIENEISEAEQLVRSGM
ncbi:hypothetical protein BC830DRAFT_267893 [Chytriomyces sp. MP71]|nr:hypothetical protein BC830DRAFT_267893 [Chytriomyces sp. MP71]